MSSIETYSKIKKEMLSQEFYFQSLLQEAYNQEELNDIQTQNIQLQCIKLFADSTERYNKGQSSSVRIEVAQSMMASSFYTIGVYLKSLPDIATALDDIKNCPVSELYQQGRRIIDTKLNIAEHLYRLVCRTKFQSENDTYNATIDEGIKVFFEQYSADYSAHETPASIDYQLMNPVADLAGVEYMIQYLQNLYMENLFCAKFSADIIHDVMLGFSRDYKDLLINIFGQVLTNALGYALLDEDILSLDLEPADIQNLKGILSKNEELLNTLLQRGADKVIEALGIADTPLIAYIYQSLPEIEDRVRTAIKIDTLQTIFVTRYSRISRQPV